MIIKGKEMKKNIDILRRQSYRLQTRRQFLKDAGLGALAFSMSGFSLVCSRKSGQRPNILFAIADDWSWPHASMAYKLGIPGSDSVVQTPAFDRIAEEGVLFKNAFCCAPSCGPSRSAILTGRYIWQLETAANLRGVLPLKYEVYPDVLELTGYHVGFTRKGWSPAAQGDHPLGNRQRNPAGPEYESFNKFMENRPEDSPFCFWCGGWDAHRPYIWESGVRSGMKPEDVSVPRCLPDDPRYVKRKNELAASLTDALRTTGDPRVLGKKHAFK